MIPTMNPTMTVTMIAIMMAACSSGAAPDDLWCHDLPAPPINGRTCGLAFRWEGARQAVMSGPSSLTVDAPLEDVYVTMQVCFRGGRFAAVRGLPRTGAPPAALGCTFLSEEPQLSSNICSYICGSSAERTWRISHDANPIQESFTVSTCPRLARDPSACPSWAIQ